MDTEMELFSSIAGNNKADTERIHPTILNMYGISVPI